MDRSVRKKNKLWTKVRGAELNARCLKRRLSNQVPVTLASLPALPSRPTELQTPLHHRDMTH